MKKRALIISAGSYRDKYFTPLKKTTADAEGLAKVLGDSEHGAFDSVETHIDADFFDVSRAVLRFYRKAEKDDLLLLYFCGHGARNAKGGLYLALADTEFDTLEASALDCAKLRSYMEDSRCKRQLLILDCCNSGNFEHSRQATPLLVDIQDQLAPAPGNLFDPSKQEGRFVLTATKKGALAFERFEGAATSPNSPYAQALIAGLSSPVAQNEQGHITVNSLHRYVNQQVTNLSKGEQHPQIMSLINDGDLLLVKSKLKPLPEDIVALLENKDPEQREFGLFKLGRLCDQDQRFIAAAEKILQGLCHTDRDPKVKSQARELRDKLLPQQTVAEPEQRKKPSATAPKRPRFPTPEFESYRKLLAASPSETALKEAKAELYGFVSANREHKEAKQLLAEVNNALNALFEQKKVEQKKAEQKKIKASRDRTKAQTTASAPKERQGLRWGSASALGVALVLVLVWQVSRERSGVPVKDSPGVAKASVVDTFKNDIEPKLGGVATPASTIAATPSPTAKPAALLGSKAKAAKQSAPEPTVKPTAADTTKLQSGALGPKMVVISAGQFLMGSPADEPARSADEGRQRTVSIEAFAMGQNEVSVAEFEQFIKSSAYVTHAERINDETGKPDGCYVYKKGWEIIPENNWRNPGFKQGKDHPVTCVSWEDAQAYVKWLNQQSGQRYRLPSEAEWEYAARARSTTPFSTGECISTAQANYNGKYAYSGCTKSEKTLGKTAAVASYAANSFGFYDMHGNVWEWAEDCWHKNYQNAPATGRAWLEEDGGDCANRVLRGGSWYDNPVILRSANRGRGTPVERISALGFRLARTLQ